MPNKVITDADWAKELEDVKPLKKKEVYRVSHDAYEVESFDDLGEVKEAYPQFMRENDALNQNHEEHVVLEETNEPFNRCEHSAELICGARVSINHDIFTKLRKGEFGYELSFDLHGYREEEAWSALHSFLRRAYGVGLRYVLVVHGKGKGYGEKGDMGIIKQGMGVWLKSSPAVLAYHSALPKHGGNGAVYVLLKRNRIHEGGF